MWKKIGLFCIRVFVIIFIITAAWCVFLKVVNKPPIETVPALIMVWISVLIVIVAIFPSILDKIKRIKVGDFEVELQDAVKASTDNNFITPEDLQNAFISGEKGNVNTLQRIIAQVLQSPQKPLLLTVNLTTKISKPFLFVYLFLLNIFSESVVVMFTKSRNNTQSVGKLKKTDVIGLISSKTVLRTFYNKFPRLIDFLAGQNFGSIEWFENVGFVRVPSRQSIETMYHLAHNPIMNVYEEQGYLNINNRNLEDLEYLSESEVRSWFMENLNKRMINLSIQLEDIEIIQECLLHSEEYFLIVENGNIKSIVITSHFTQNVTKKVINQLKKAK